MSRSRPCVYWFITGLVLCFIVVGLPIIVYTVVVKPRNPTFTLVRATVTGFNLTNNGHLTSFFGIHLRAHNRNHMLKLKYQDVRVSVFKHNQNLGTESVPGFTQRKGNITFFRAELVALNVPLKKGPAFDFKHETGMGYLDFDVYVTASLNAGNLEVNCSHAVVNLTAPVVVDVGAASKFRSIDCSVFVYSDN